LKERWVDLMERKMIKRRQIIKCPKGHEVIVRFNSRPPAPRWAYCDICKTGFIAYPRAASSWMEWRKNAWLPKD